MVDIRGDRVFADVQHQQGRLLLELGTDVDLHIQRDQTMVVKISDYQQSMTPAPSRGLPQTTSSADGR
jgi:hypothetical protein